MRWLAVALVLLGLVALWVLAPVYCLMSALICLISLTIAAFDGKMDLEASDE